MVRCICSDARINLRFIWWDVKSILEYIIANIKRSSLDQQSKSRRSVLLCSRWVLLRWQSFRPDCQRGWAISSCNCDTLILIQGESSMFFAQFIRVSYQSRHVLSSARIQQDVVEALDFENSWDMSEVTVEWSNVDFIVVTIKSSRVLLNPSYTSCFKVIDLEHCRYSKLCKLSLFLKIETEKWSKIECWERRVNTMRKNEAQQEGSRILMSGHDFLDREMEGF